MSKYTTEVRFICETAAGLETSEGYLSVNQIIKAALPSVFEFDYPIFDETYRPLLETKILKHFYTREIGLETVGLWKLKLDAKLNEIMPYYNQLYKSTLLEFNPFHDVDITRKRDIENTGNQNMNGNTTGKTTNETDTTSHSVNETDFEDTQNNTQETKTKVNSKNLMSETPQGSISDLEEGKYLTEARIILNDDSVDIQTDSSGNSKTTTTNDYNDSGSTVINNETDTTSVISINNMEDYIETIKGKQGSSSYSSLIKEFRETFLNIDMLIIDELSELFMNIW